MSDPPRCPSGSLAPSLSRVAWAGLLGLVLGLTAGCGAAPGGTLSTTPATSSGQVLAGTADITAATRQTTSERAPSTSGESRPATPDPPTLATSTRSATGGTLAAPTTAACLMRFPVTGSVRPIDMTRTTVSCEQARRVLNTYLAIPVDGDHGNTNMREVDGWTCYCPTAARSEASDVSAACERPGARIVVHH